MPEQHLFDQVGGELAQWMHETAGSVANELAGGSHAPFAAPVSEAQKLEYYRAKLFNPDGSPNVQERQSLLDRAGVDGYVKVLSALGKSRPGEADHPQQAQIADQALGTGGSYGS